MAIYHGSNYKDILKKGFLSDFHNLVYLNGDDDTAYGGAGFDEICGGSGNDTIWGGRGGDTLYSERGNDALYGDGGSSGMADMGVGAHRRPQDQPH